MEDLAAIAMVMFVAWIASAVALVALAWLAPATWSRTLRLALMLVAAALFWFLTVVLFGIRDAAVYAFAAAVAAFVVYFTIRSRRGG